jgi:hypothetical protein
MTKGIKHKDVSTELTSTEFQADDAHFLDSGTSFPTSPAPTEMDTFYRTDLHKWYVHNGTEWKELGAAGTPTITDVGTSTGSTDTSSYDYWQKQCYTPSSPTLIASVAVTVAAGEKVRMIYCGHVTSLANYQGTLLIKRGSTLLTSKQPFSWTTYILDDDPGAGTYTYYIYLTCQYQDYPSHGSAGMGIITVK